jgi:hypothetical protein
MTYLSDARTAKPAVAKTLKIFESLNRGPSLADKKTHGVVLSDSTTVEVKFDTWIIKTGNIAMSGGAIKKKGLKDGDNIVMRISWCIFSISIVPTYLI